jgi:hypothetical protein
MQNRTKTIAWRAIAWEGQERLTLQMSDAGIEARSELSGATEDGTPYEIRYLIELSPDWQVQHVHIEDTKDEGGLLDLIYENGKWFAGLDDYLGEEFDNVPFVDITLTPFTNTPPIKQLNFEGTESQKINVLYIDLPSFTWRRVEQYYSKIGNNTYHYQDVEKPDFQADIVVDDDGLMVVYPNLFTAAADAADSNTNTTLAV